MTATAAALDRLTAIMARLRDPERGCPWDREQTFATIAPYSIEEAYEVADAIAARDLPALREELGDLLLQVVFHARMAEELGAFNLADVTNGIADKMERRHPHIFGDADARNAAQLADAWEAIKAAEKPRASALDGIARALPALIRADKLGHRAAGAGFDWADADGARAKLAEELAELAAATDDQARADEMGDVLLAAANLARHHGVDPEAALRAANDKFERRFRAIETAGGPGFAALDGAAKEALWRDTKAREATRAQ